MLSIAVWGIGNHALRNTIPAISQADGVRLAGLLSRDPEKSAKLADENHCDFWQSSSDMLADNSVDCVYIASPVGTHYEQVISALDAGKHVFCEKSLTDDYKKTVRLFELANRKNLMLFECFMYLYHRQFRKLQELLSGNEIGEVFSISARFGFPHLDSENIRYKKDYGGGALLDAGVYPLSAILTLLDGEVMSVAGSKFHLPDYEVDIRGSACVSSSHGVVGHALWGMGLDYRNEIEIWGTGGSIEVSRAFSKPADFESEIIVVKNGQRHVVESGADNHFIGMFESFSSSGDNQQTMAFGRDISLGVANIASRLSAVNE